MNAVQEGSRHKFKIIFWHWQKSPRLQNLSVKPPLRMVLQFLNYIYSVVALGPDVKQVFPEDRSDPTFNEEVVVEQLLLLRRYIGMNYLFVLLGRVSVSFEHVFES